MAAIKALSSKNAGEDDRMLEAAEALAALARMAAVGESVSERVKGESTAGNSRCGPIESLSKRTIHVNENQVDICQKVSQKTCIWTTKPVRNEQKTELRSNVSSFKKHASSGGRKSRRTLTEAEKEARNIRRVLANRESARQTIRRRQAIFEELTRKAGDLAWENNNMKQKKVMATMEVETLKCTNKCLKAQMIKIRKVKAGEIHDDTSSSSSNSPIIMCQPPVLPFTWPTLIVLPHPWLFSFLQSNYNQHHPCSFNLNEKPVDFSPGTLLSNSMQIMHKSHQVPGVCSVKTICDMAAAAEARKRRKQLKMQKDFCCRQRRMR